jgi:hypothetical protein
MMSGEKNAIDSKYKRSGYVGLILCLLCLLGAFHWISSSVPVLRTQESAVHLPTNVRQNGKEVTAFLNAWPSDPQLLVYDFHSKSLDVHSVMAKTRFLFGETGDRYQIERKPSKNRTFREAMENAIANAKAGVSVQQIWQATTFNKTWSPQSVVNFEFPRPLTFKPILLLQHFAVGFGREGIHIVDLESEGHESRSFSFPMEESTLITTTRIGNNRIARARDQGTSRNIDLFEIASDGDVALIKSWDVGVVSRSKTKGGVVKPVNDILYCLGDRIYSQSASGNKIEERSLSCDLLSSFEVPGLELSKQEWSFHGSYLHWFEEGFESSYFDLETRAFLKIPATLLGAPSSIGRAKVANREWVIFSGFTDSLSVPQIANFDRISGELVGSWPRNPYHSYTTIHVGDRTEILATGFEWGISFTKHNLEDGAVLETHFPLRTWFVGISILAVTVLGWSLAWLRFSARNGGNAWLDIYLVSGVLLGLGLWRLGTTGFPFSLDRLPYEYLTGIYFGLLAVVIFKLMDAPHSDKNRLVHLCSVLPIGRLLIAHFLTARIPPYEGMRSTQFGSMGRVEPVVFGMLIVITLILLCICFLSRRVNLALRTEEKRPMLRSFFRAPHFSIRDLLWAFVLLALLCQPISYPSSEVRYFLNAPWWWVIGNSAWATSAIAIAFVLGATQNKTMSRIGWIMSVLVLCLLLGEFAFDFANGKPPPFSRPFSGGFPGLWRIGRAILTESVVAFVFLRRISTVQCHSRRELTLGERDTQANY